MIDRCDQRTALLIVVMMTAVIRMIDRCDQRTALLIVVMMTAES